MQKNERGIIPAPSKLITVILLESVKNVNVNVIISTVPNVSWPLRLSTSFMSLPGIWCLASSGITLVWNTKQHLDNLSQNHCKGNNYLVCHWGKSPKSRENNLSEMASLSGYLSAVLRNLVMGMWDGSRDALPDPPRENTQSCPEQGLQGSPLL